MTALCLEPFCGGRLDLAINRVVAALAPKCSGTGAIDVSADILSDLVLLAEIGGINEILRLWRCCHSHAGGRSVKSNDDAAPEITIIGPVKNNAGLKCERSPRGARPAFYHGKEWSKTGFLKFVPVSY